MLILALLFALIVASNVESTHKLPYRIAYFANKITEKTYPVGDVSEISITAENCIIYLLENDNTLKTEVEVSASWSAEITDSLVGTALSYNVKSTSGTVQCYIELKIPGGTTLTKLTLALSGKKQDVFVFDSKDNSGWVTPLTITDLIFTFSESFPRVFLTNLHDVTKLTASGDYCVCDFNKVKINEMDFQVAVGSLNVLQNSLYADNKITLQTPLGTQCVAGTTVNTVDTNCPSAAVRTAGITATTVDTTTYCLTELYVCNSAVCPASGTAIAAGKGNFLITLDDGPVQFLIDGSTTGASINYLPDTDTFSVTSQNLLRENNADYTDDTNSPRMYVYEVSSPGYAHPWIHLFHKQYLQARPWLMSILSFNFLSPVYFKQNLIHIPSGTCPNAASTVNSVNTYISDKIKELSYTDAKHVVATFREDDYFTYELNSDNKHVREAVSFLDKNWILLACFLILIITAVIFVLLVFLVLCKLKFRFDANYTEGIQHARGLLASKKLNSGSSTDISKYTNKFAPVKVRKQLLIGLFSSSEEQIEVKETDVDNLKNRNMKEKRKNAYLSFYKTLDMEVDKYFRTRKNPIREFFEHVEMKPSYFRQYEGNAQDNVEYISIRLDLLRAKYLEFCTKYGYKSIRLLKNQKILHEYGLKIEYLQTAFTASYVRIRWKTAVEKIRNEELKNRSNEDADGSKEDSSTSIEKFINYEC